MITCPNCKTTNTEGAKFCRSCGAELFSQPTNVMDRFPEYFFVPTNLIDWKRPKAARIRTRFLYLLLLVAVVFSVYSIIVCLNPSIDSGSKWDTNWNDEHECVEGYFKYVDVSDPLEIFQSEWRSSQIGEELDSSEHFDAVQDFRRENVGPFIILGIVLSLMLVWGIKFSKRKYPPKNSHLKDVADYIQKYSYSGFFDGRKKPILKFFVKDNMMGLMDVAHYCVYLPAKYDELEWWREKNKYLNATVGNRTFIIDINGKELK